MPGLVYIRDVAGRDCVGDEAFGGEFGAGGSRVGIGGDGCGRPACPPFNWDCNQWDEELQGEKAEEDGEM